jgi:lipase
VPTERYRAFDVPVDGGLLRVGEWGAADPAAPVVLGVHGITATHVSWQLVAERLPGVRFLAPDLRGRGRSAGLPGPYGMARHADDVAEVLRFAGVQRAVVVGHSMGGFVTTVLGHRHPDRVASRVLVDGGLPVISPAVLRARSPEAALGPAMDRLARTFADLEENRAFWRAHPALAGSWNDAVEAYVDYDLAGTPPALRSSVRAEAVRADTHDLIVGPSLRRAMLALPRERVDFLRAARGMQDEPAGLYPVTVLRLHRLTLPRLHWATVEGVNHYTIVMGDRGATAVAAVVRQRLGALAAAGGPGAAREAAHRAFRRGDGKGLRR